jgi:hypothetical protein
MTANNQTKIFLRLFYALKLLFISWSFQLYAPYYEQQNGTSTWLGDILTSLISSNIAFYLLSLPYFALLFFIISRPLNLKLKLTEAFYALLLVACLYKGYHTGHSIYGFLLCSFPLSFLNHGNSKNKNLFSAAINIHLATYVCSGLWKLIIFIKATAESGMSNASSSFLSHHFTVKLLKVSATSPYVDWFLDLHWSIKAITWLVIIFFQLLLLIPILKNNYPIILGITIIAFHFGTLVFMDINFIEAQALTALFFFLGTEIYNQKENKQEK